MSFITYLREVRAELVHISWPTPRQAVMYTVFIILISLFAAAYIGALDFVFEMLLKQII